MSELALQFVCGAMEYVCCCFIGAAEWGSCPAGSVDPVHVGACRAGRSGADGVLAADRVPNAEIARVTGTSRPTVIGWRGRYEVGGIDALGDLPRPGRPGEVGEIGVVAATLADEDRPPERLGVTHWSARLLGRGLGIAFGTIAKIWRKWDIQPHRTETAALHPHVRTVAEHDGDLSFPSSPARPSAAAPSPPYATSPMASADFIDGWNDRCQPFIWTNMPTPSPQNLTVKLLRTRDTSFAVS